MIKKLLAAFTLAVSIGSAFAAVDINTANSDALRGIKGMGRPRRKPFSMNAKHMVRSKTRPSLSKRVKGMGGKTVERLQAEGLTIGPGGAACGGRRRRAKPAAGAVVVKK